MSTVRLTTAQALVRFLAAQHSERDGERARLVEGVWGIFGHGNLCGLGAAIAECADRLPFHQPKNEQAMVHAAMGFAKARRRLSTFACTASVGPGATNLVTGAATATINRLPVLLLPAEVFAGRRAGPVLQQLQHASSRDWTVNECLRPVSRFFDRITRPEQLLDALPEAMRVLADPAETGAVTIALPQDVQAEAADFPAALFEPRTWAVARRPPEHGALMAAAAAIRAARRPLVIAGGGVRYSAAEDALARLADRHGLPVAETSAGKGTFEGELSVGGIGVNGAGAANRLAAHADLVVCVGTRLSDFSTASRSLFADREVRFVGINVVAADAAHLGAVAVVADARAALEALDAELGDWQADGAHVDDVRTELRRWKDAVTADLASRPDERMSQAQVLRALEATMRPRDWLVAAAGSPPGDLLKLWRCAPGSAAHLEFGYSCMGHEIPAGLGIRLSDPGGEVHVVIGDGTYLMAPTELVTAAQEGVSLTVVLLVNDGYQSIHALQRAAGGESFGNEFGPGAQVDYAASARSFGCAAWDVTDLDEVPAALEAARAHPGPALVACHVEPYRMTLPSGAWWDLGTPDGSPAAAGRERQRWFG